MKFLLLLSLTLILFRPQGATAQADRGTVERIKVHGAALEGNLSGDPADRDVSVYLPPSYGHGSRRYPVLYVLHGFTDSDAQWMGFVDHWINLPEVIDAALEDDSAREMIVVMPNGFTRFHGSMYSSSATTGDWETFVTRDLVEHIDANYRTIPSGESRGLAGHSMGGYGTIRLAMKRPEVFSSIYVMSPCCLEGGAFANPQAEAVTSVEEIQGQNFFTLATLASAAAWAPNPAKPPFYLDLPSENGEILPDIARKFAANAPLVMLDQYVPSLKRLRAIALDAGNQDRGISGATRVLHERLDVYGIPHVYEAYEGDHLNRIAERIRTTVLPFFSQLLVFE